MGFTLCEVYDPLSKVFQAHSTKMKHTMKAKTLTLLVGLQVSLKQQWVKNAQRKSQVVP